MKVNLSHSTNWEITVINASAAVTLLEQRPAQSLNFSQVSVQVVLRPHLH